MRVLGRENPKAERKRKGHGDLVTFLLYRCPLGGIEFEHT